MFSLDKLSHRAGEVDPSQRHQGMALLDRVALLVRGLCERIDKSLPDRTGPGTDKVWDKVFTPREKGH